MEPTEAALNAAAIQLQSQTPEPRAGLNYFRHYVEPAVRAAFATIPDPTALADEWERASPLHYEYGEHEIVMDCAAQLRAFIRNDGNG